MVSCASHELSPVLGEGGSPWRCCAGGGSLSSGGVAFVAQRHAAAKYCWGARSTCRTGRERRRSIARRAQSRLGGSFPSAVLACRAGGPTGPDIYKSGPPFLLNAPDGRISPCCRARKRA
jgi:hypothetical protein